MQLDEMDANNVFIFNIPSEAPLISFLHSPYVRNFFLYVPIEQLHLT